MGLPRMSLTWSGTLIGLKPGVTVPSVSTRTGIGLTPCRQSVAAVLPRRYRAAWARALVWHDTTWGKPAAACSPPFADLETPRGRLIARVWFTPVSEN